jgi:hypothetical protein
MLARYGERFDAHTRGRALRFVGGVLLVLAVALAGKAALAVLV